MPLWTARSAEEGALERRQAGFSLIELMIALVVTLIISGAVYQLLTSGQTAFRREPEMADRQQNARMAMDVISKDIYQAGNGLPPFMRVFTDGLDGFGASYTPPIMGSGGAYTDEIEMTSSAGCGSFQVCKQSGANLFLWGSLDGCLNFPVPVIVACTTPGPPKAPLKTPCPAYGVFWAEEPGGPGSSGTGNCASGNDDGNNGHVNFPPGKGQPPVFNPPGGIDFAAEYMVAGSVVRYRIALDQGVPCLERSALGGAATYAGASSWVIIARGIEDLQIQYMSSAAPGDHYTNLPPAPGGVNDYDNLVRRVRVTLSSRAVDSARVVGATNPSAAAAAAGVPAAIRGQLVSEITPRAAQTTVATHDSQL